MDITVKRYTISWSVDTRETQMQIKRGNKTSPVLRDRMIGRLLDKQKDYHYPNIQRDRITL